MSLLVLRVYVFVCDICERDTGEITPPNPDDGARSAWRDAQRRGWTRHGGDVHHCPDHRTARSAVGAALLLTPRTPGPGR